MYGRHWSLTGEDVPDYDAAIDADYLPGRNVLLLGLTAVWCALHDTHKIALGSLMQNPYPDATPEFFRDYGTLLTGALTHGIEVLTPYRSREKDELIREHPELPLHLTLTCIGQKPGEASDGGAGRGPAALRRLPQVPRAPRGVRRSRRAGPHALRGRAEGLTHVSPAAAP